MRRLFAAHAVSRAGDAFNTVALVVLVYRLTGSGIEVAGTVAFEIAPLLVLGPVAGIVADRLPRRRVMMAAGLMRAALAAALAVSHSTVALAYGVAFGLSAGSLVFNPAASSLVPEVVGVDERELVDANSLLWTVAVVAQIALAPAAGGLIAAVGVGSAFALNAASFVASAFLLSRLDAGTSPAAVDVRGWAAVRAGLDAIRGHALLAGLAVVQVLASLSAGATSGLLVVLATERFGVGPSGFGLLLACIGLGAAAGPGDVAAPHPASGSAVALRTVRSTRRRRLDPRDGSPPSGRGRCARRIRRRDVHRHDRLPVDAADHCPVRCSRSQRAAGSVPSTLGRRAPTVVRPAPPTNGPPPRSPSRAVRHS